MVRPLLLGLHAHFRTVRFVRVSAWMPISGPEKARLSEPISLRSPQSYLSTAAKWGISKLDALRGLFNGNAWLPPGLEPAG